MPHISHIAIWTLDIDRLAVFWIRHFGAELGPLYASTNRPGFISKWLSLPGGPRIELMSGPWVTPSPGGEPMGYAHVALSLGSAEAVDALAKALQAEGALVKAPRHTGDGYYEALARDPDGNLVEITL